MNPVYLFGFKNGGFHLQNRPVLVAANPAYNPQSTINTERLKPSINQNKNYLFKKLAVIWCYVWPQPLSMTNQSHRSKGIINSK